MGTPCHPCIFSLMEVSHLGSCGIEGEELRNGLCLSGTALFFAEKLLEEKW